MPNSWRQIRLPEIVSAMASRPRHEALRGLITELLRDGFDARFAELDASTTGCFRSYDGTVIPF